MDLKHGWLNSNFSYKFGILTVMFLLSACGSKDNSEQEAKDEKVDKSIVLSADGIGPISASTSFNMHQMTLAFSDYNVVEEMNFQSGSPYPVIRISDGVKTMLVINPDASQQNIFSVMVEDNLIKNSLGHHLGSTYSDVYSYGQSEECQPGSEDLAGKVLCYAPKTPNVLYVFAGKKQGKTAMPPADVLQGWGLESIIWRPKS